MALSCYNFNAITSNRIQNLNNSNVQMFFFLSTELVYFHIHAFILIVISKSLEGFELVDNHKTSKVILMAVLVVEHVVVFCSFSTSSSLRLEAYVVQDNQRFILLLQWISKLSMISKCR